jgi:hypothetical protein
MARGVVFHERRGIARLVPDARRRRAPGATACDAPSAENAIVELVAIPRETWIAREKVRNSALDGCLRTT